METMLGTHNIAQTIAWLGFVLAFIFGYVANKTSFCTMGAVSDVVNMGEWGRMRAWLLAIAVAILGTNLLVYYGYLDLGQTYYTRGTVYWFGALVGGLTFGIGMTLDIVMTGPCCECFTLVNSNRSVMYFNNRLSISFILMF